jgi:RNA polymerase sigma-70 factor (ECF subfamily)
VQYRHTFNGGDFRPWIFTVTRHSCLSAKKRGFRDNDGVEHAGDGVNLEGASDDVRLAFSFKDDPLERMSAEEQTGLLLAAIAKLPDEFREALILSEYEGLSYEEIGRMMGVSLSTIRIRIFRAKARLRKMLLPVIGDAAGMNHPDDPENFSSGPKGKKKN